MMPVSGPATPSSIASGAGGVRPLYSRSLTRTGVRPFQSASSPENAPRAAVTASQRNKVVLPEPASPRSSTRQAPLSPVSTRIPEFSPPASSQSLMSGRSRDRERTVRRPAPSSPVARRLTYATDNRTRGPAARSDVRRNSSTSSRSRLTSSRYRRRNAVSRSVPSGASRERSGSRSRSRATSAPSVAVRASSSAAARSSKTGRLRTTRT
jgi:hypothetical protein